MQHFTKCIVLLYEEHRKRRTFNATRLTRKANNLMRE